MRRIFDRSGGLNRLVMMLTIFIATRAWAAPTQDEVFRSINQSVGSTVDLKKIIPYVMLAVGFVIMVALFNYRRQRQAMPRAFNHPGKLLKEISREIDLKSSELKQLKTLAEGQELEFPLTLLLCPSVLGKAARAGSANMDRKIIQQLVQRLRAGLAAPKTAAPSPNAT